MYQISSSNTYTSYVKIFIKNSIQYKKRTNDGAFSFLYLFTHNKLELKIWYIHIDKVYNEVHLYFFGIFFS